MKEFLLGILTVLIIGAIAVGAYLFGKKNAATVLPSASVFTTVQESGIPSPSLVPAVAFSPPPSPVKTENDNELIKQALFKKNGWPDDGSITIKVSTNDGKYASGTASSQGGGGYFYAAKVNGNWEIVADGNGVILCSSLTKYPDFPKSLIPECYDSTTGKTVKR